MPNFEVFEIHQKLRDLQKEKCGKEKKIVDDDVKDEVFHLVRLCARIISDRVSAMPLFLVPRTRPKKDISGQALAQRKQKIFTRFSLGFRKQEKKLCDLASGKM